MEGTIGADDPRAADVRALLEAHLALMNEQSPPEDVHALDVDALAHPSIAFVSYRLAGDLLGVGALKDLGDGHGELKSMHTVAAARDRGVGRALLVHLVGLATTSGMNRVSLETGTQEEFRPARSLYAAAGFTECGPFADYALSPWSVFMTRAVTADG